MASQSYTLDHLKNNLGVVSANIHYGNAIRTAEFLAVFDSLIAVFGAYPPTQTGSAASID
ncbi:glycolipid transfer protein HET-C2 [Colletotrichum tofieldiae]|nr:glycolipid transfer protein HET-C2 [Colletotrichum tofieldiae]GKT71409.1 glycolipid transfer protein HET-C2 [Colletotrichum tofieldiae]GKT93661.1 glycolipid transfer protein HET-C2 [Colletotrichum tofieldiae]